LQTEEYARKQGAQEAAKAEPRAPKGPRQRPVRTHGVTERVKTGEGYLYVTINEDESGMCEVFTTIGKAGGNAAAQSEAISRLISLALRSGIEPREVIKQLKGISGPTSVWDGQGGQILSTPDAIGQVLERYLDERDKSSPRAAKAKKAKTHHGVSHQPAAPHASPPPRVRKHRGTRERLRRLLPVRLVEVLSPCPKCASALRFRRRMRGLCFCIR
jgi:hypothetical protein